MSGDRCTGHCCRCFSLPYGPDELATRKARIKDGEQIVAMVRYLGRTVPPGMPHQRNESSSDHYYTCTNLLANGDCGIYETRPGMCRNFPDDGPCPYPQCENEATRYHVKLSALTRKRWKLPEFEKYEVAADE